MARILCHYYTTTMISYELGRELWGTRIKQIQGNFARLSEVKERIVAKKEIKNFLKFVLNSYIIEE
jgi:hypothetical protein